MTLLTIFFYINYILILWRGLCFKVIQGNRSVVQPVTKKYLQKSLEIGNDINWIAGWKKGEERFSKAAGKLQFGMTKTLKYFRNGRMYILIRSF